MIFRKTKTPGFKGLERRHSWIQNLLMTTSRPQTVVYDLTLSKWTAPPLTVAIASDLHVAAPWFGPKDVTDLTRRLNAFPVDMVLLLGDFLADRWMIGIKATAEDIATRLSKIKAPLGVHTILGNHDWADDLEARQNGYTASAMAKALTEAGLPPLVNAARCVDHGPDGLWLVGLDSQQGHLPRGKGGARHDPETAWADVPDGALSVLLAHEPDIFAKGDARPAIQLSGHTHGGQITLFGKRFVTASDYGERFVYGHVVEDDRHLLVSGGIGFGGIPVRICQPPEITLVRLSGPQETPNG